MTEKQMVKILKFISDIYTGKFEFPKETKEATKTMIQTWLTFLKDYPADIVFNAVKQLAVKEPVWPPTPGMIVQEINDIKSPEKDKLTGEDAFEMAVEAVRKYGSYNVAEAKKALPPRVWKTIECMGGFDVLGMSDPQDTFFRKQFVDRYEQIKERETERASLPPSMREEVDQLVKKYGLPFAIEGETEGEE